ncbi:MAG: NAD(P)/FAD-dependent oxidoreductase [Candidatus Omnitrophica bacterium]|nr:NAD(P)/FAD-dependent oxidoreductase [Candidatus Omnitrophota bacterium]
MHDIIIIGGGVVGTAIARELSKYRLKIAILEKEVEIAFGVSKSNSGIIHPGTQNKSNSLKGKLCVEGNKLVRKLAKKLGIDFKEVGQLIVAFNQEEIERLKEIKKEGELLGIKKMKIVFRPWLAVNEPNLNPEIIAALLVPSAGIISPYRMAYDLSENAAKNGVEIYTDCEVTNIKKDKYFEIESKLGVFSSRYIINAAGLFADDIARMAGIKDIKIKPRKGQEFLLDKKKENITNHLIFPLPSQTSKGTLVIKTSDGNPMIGPTAEEVEDKYDLSTDESGLAQVISSVKRLVPSINPKDIIAYFAGLRPVSGEDFIIREEKSVKRFINVAGIQSPGLTAAPAIALYVSKLLKTSGLKFKRKLNFKPFRRKTIHLFQSDKKLMKKIISKNKAFGDIVCRCELVSRAEIEAAIERGAKTMDGIKFRTRAQSGRCHGGFCTTRIMRILSEKLNIPLNEISKRGGKSGIVVKERG